MQPYNKHQEKGRPPSAFVSSHQSNHQPAPKKTGKKARLLIVGAFITIFVYWASSLWFEQQEILAEKNMVLEEMKSKVKEANHLQRELSFQIKRLDDRDYIEEIARRDYFLSYKGEIIFKVPNE